MHPGDGVHGADTFMVNARIAQDGAPNFSLDMAADAWREYSTLYGIREKLRDLRRCGYLGYARPARILPCRSGPQECAVCVCVCRIPTGTQYP